MKELEINKIMKIKEEKIKNNKEFTPLVNFLKSVKPFDLEFAMSTEGEGGFTNGEKIVISLDLKDEYRFNTLLHEFGHHYLDHAVDGKGYEGHVRGIKERFYMKLIYILMISKIKIELLILFMILKLKNLDII
ncbi:hypothetical protein [Spiroplasma taiwanense]|nr:hypothetical protein [Spiroplasma taiwanense]